MTSITTENYTSGTKVTTTETIDYDQIGNPITYRGATMAWRGRQLTGYAKNGVTSTFSYDADGGNIVRDVEISMTGSHTYYHLHYYYEGVKHTIEVIPGE